VSWQTALADRINEYMKQSNDVRRITVKLARQDWTQIIRLLREDDAKQSPGDSHS
jgi:hypothetical protein